MNCDGCKMVAVINGSSHCAAPSCPREKGKQMMKDTPQGQTNHCPMCEDAARQFADMQAMYNAQCQCTDEWAEKYRVEVSNKADATLVAEINGLRESLAKVNGVLALTNSENTKLERHNAMMVYALKHIEGLSGFSEALFKSPSSVFSDMSSIHQWANSSINATSAQSSAWLERKHVEWMKSLQPEAYKTKRGAVYLGQFGNEADGDRMLYAIPSEKE